MQIRGKLEDRSPADLLEWLHQDKLSGVLRFWRPGTKVRKDFWLEKGEIVSSGTNEPREYLGSFLIAQGKINERDFVRAYRTQLETKVLFGKVLTMFGLVTDREVEVALKEKAEESVWDVFLWRDGKYEFDDSVALGGQRLPLRIEIDALIREGERRVIDWGMVHATFPHLDVEVEVVGGTDSPGNLEKRVLEEIAAKRPLSEIALELRQSDYLFLRRMTELVKKGRVKILEVREHQEPLLATDVDIAEKDVEPPPPMNEALSGALFETGVPGERISIDALKARIPVLKTTRNDLVKQKFSAEEGYLLSRIDDHFDAGIVATLCPFRESVAFTALSALAVRGILTLQKP